MDTQMSEAKPEDYFDRYSRQYYVIGARAMNSLGKASVLISGITGLGLEIAKNVTLAGPKSVTLNDTVEATLADLSTHYYLKQSDMGKNRASISVPHVSELNPYVKVDSTTEDLQTSDLQFLLGYSCVVLVGLPLKTQLRVNSFCRTNKISFLTADNYGLFAWSFVDLGDEFTIFDKNGELEKEIFVSKISQSAQAEVTTLENTLHDLEDGDHVKFSELVGMDPLNFKEGTNEVDFKVTVINPKQFTINVDTTSYPAYVRGGLAIEKKQNFVSNFKSLADSIASPLFLDSDLAKFERPYQMHTAVQALHAFVESHNRLPAPWNQADADLLFEIALKLDKVKKKFSQNSSQDAHKPIIEKLAFTSRGSLISIAATIGGFVAQEVIKAVSGKFTPLKQWLHFDALELIHDATIADFADFQPSGTRYDSQIICIGRKTHQKLQDANLFMVGAGAIGCELIKNYAMLGISTGSGKITVTDNDVIEKSNLNRQFLFRDHDIRQSKSLIASKAAININPDMKFEANLDKVGADTEYKYKDEFFQAQTCIVNALDNIDARIYMDTRCIKNLRPLLESGTMGTKGHVQVILPHQTETYQDTRDPPEKDVPYCTIRSFPASINHTIEWARDKFQILFIQKPRELKKFLSNPSAYISSVQGSSGPSFSTLAYLLKMCNNPVTQFSDCIRIARRKFEHMFMNDIKQLLNQYPLDHTNSDGAPFWALPKRPPTPTVFDIDNELHYNFLWHVSSLLAFIYNVSYDQKQWPEKEQLKKALSTVVLPEFYVKNKSIITDESVKAPQKEVIDVDKFQTVLDQLKKAKAPELKLTVDDFEKDDDTNHHVDFIHAASNLRAVAYQISPADRMETKRIAGKIIPAIATTTTIVSGLVSLELIKIVKGVPLECHKNTYLNLGLPLFSMSEPAKAKKSAIPGTAATYTVWDSWEIKGRPNITLNEFCQHFEEKFTLTVAGVFQEVTTIYMSLFPAHMAKLKLKLCDLIAKVDEPYVDLTVAFEDENGDDVNGPLVRFWYK